MTRKYRMNVWMIALAGILFGCAVQLSQHASFAQSALAETEVVDNQIAEAEKLVAHVDFDGAISILERTQRRVGLTHEQMTRVYRNLAVSHAVVGHQEIARNLFVKLLAIDPDFKVDANMTPRVQAPFYEARGFWTAQTIRPGIEVGVAMHQDAGSTIRLTLRDPTRLVNRIVVGYRWDRSEAFTTKSLPPDSKSAVLVPPPARGSTRLEYYMRAVDVRDGVLFERGGPDNPLSSAVSASAPGGSSGQAERSRSFLASPIFWTAAGIVLVGGVAAFVATRSDTASPTAEQLTANITCAARPCP